ncbi:MAG: DUF4357 domain-containing protein [Clostridiales bacterium]|nr:DUF4357 domain-containing protein [Clostridiales bacterium]
MADHQPPIRTGLLDFFRKSQGCQFVIPVYQRNYSWTSGKEVAQYLEDLISVLKNEYNNHFLGILIYLDTPIDSFTREYSVIDGQQRLTTTFIILYAIKALLKEKGDTAAVANLEGQYLTNPYSDDKMKYKLKPLVADDEVYQQIVEERFDEIKATESNVYKNYLYVIEKLRTLIGKGYSANDILMALNKLYVVCVPISEDDNAQKIFESINATGVKLTASDLIRNFILMDLKSDIQDKFYKDYWKKIEEYISGDAKKLELFFRMYLTVKTWNLPNKNAIYRNFVSWVKNSGMDAESILKDIVLYAEAYYCIYRKDVSELDSAIRDSIKEFRRILSDMPAPALMKFYLLYKDGSINEATLSKLVNMINCYLVRRYLCNLDTKNITRMLPTFIRDVLDDCNNDYSKIVDIVGKHLVFKNVGNMMYMPSDQQMRDIIEPANMYSLRLILRIFFDKLELTGNPAPVDLSALSVEHIIPQSMPASWLDDLNIDEETYQLNLHRLGNLTLAAKPDNSAMGDKPWEYKNAILKSTSHLKMNEEILKADKWTIEKINERTTELIEKMIELYPYPEINEEVIQKEAIVLECRDAIATGYLSLEDGSVEIDVGSSLVARDDAESFPSVEEIRQELLEDEIIAEIDGKLQFVKPYIFYSSQKNSTALTSSACVIAHGNKNGWIYWKYKDGKSIRENSIVQAKFGEQSEVESTE